ncbi:10827_t:CDS:1 [Acaulospora morrowiae]|uniref:Phosphatidylglycerol/phosphatidylinositol transfer protein n=1 Tax=Acaulospora morrowiae TaxID=94023 RepID=A0A9N9AM75_9GLOM|nr:10827_t:CDS:1 [Acaulospora morrowiae]
MNKNFLLVFILFATLSAVNSLPHKHDKRISAIKWTTCFDIPKLNVVANDPVEGQKDTFTVSGPIPSDINANDKLYMIFIDIDDPTRIFKFLTDVCGAKGLPQCPIKGGAQFDVNITLTIPTFSGSFIIYAMIGNKHDGTLGCAYTNI